MIFQSRIGFGLAIFFLGLGIYLVFSELGSGIEGLGISRTRKQMQRIFLLLQELEETLAAGLVPSSERWAALKGLPRPWGSLAFDSVSELRSCGAALLPTLKRLRALAEFQNRTLAEAQSRSSQAMAQALFCLILVPAFGWVLEMMLPGVAESGGMWWFGCGVGVLVAGIGALWLLKLADAARWAGLSREYRPWVLASQCAGERFLALLRSGNPADLSWNKACELLTSEAPALSLAWGHSVWQEPPRVPASGASALALIQAGGALRKAVQISLMEGRPCSERVEHALESLRHEIKTQVDRELTLLPARALKPLFLCVAPPIFGLLAFGVYLCWIHVV